MNNLTKPAAADFKALQVLHLALMIGAILMTSVLGFIMSSDGIAPAPISWLEGFPLYAIVIMAFEIVMSFVLWNMRQSKLPTNATVDEKLMHYRSSCILRWACLEGGVLISVIFAFLAHNPAIFAVSTVGLALMFLARPSKDYLMEKYGVDAYS